MLFILGSLETPYSGLPISHNNLFTALRQKIDRHSAFLKLVNRNFSQRGHSTPT